MNGESQFNVETAQASYLVRMFDMSNGLKSFLIDPDGTIVAVDPATETIAALASI